MEKTQKINFFIIIIYSSLITGYFFGEDSIGGAYKDYAGLQYVAEKFNNNFILTLLNYDELGHRQSPIFFIFKSLVIDFGENFHRLFFLHLFLLIPLFFYKSLKLTYPKVDKYYLKIFSLILLLFPTIRSYSIWPDPHLLGVLFFTISIYFYLKFKFIEKKNHLKNSLLNTFFLALAAYCSPNFGVFVIFFLFDFFKKYKFSNKIFFILLLNFLLSIPFFYYLFVLDINFIFNDVGWDVGENFYSLNNIFNKFIIIISIFFIYLLPLLVSKELDYKFTEISNSKIEISIYLIIFVIACYFFDFSNVYKLTNSGGGVIYHLSNYIFNNNYLLFTICFFTYLYLIQTFKFDRKNLILFTILILSNPQITIWQANFSPTIFFLIFLLFNSNFKKEFFKLRTIYICYIYFFLYLVVSISKKMII